MDQSNNNVFTGNLIANSYGGSEGYGFYVASSSNNNQFKDNIISKNGQYGIRFYPYNTASSGNLFEHNLVSDHLVYGIYGFSAGANTYKDNYVLNNSNTGIIVSGATGQTVAAIMSKAVITESTAAQIIIIFPAM